MLNPNDPELVAHSQSVFLRISDVKDDSKHPVVTTLLEIDSEGYIPREIGLAEDGTAVYVTRPGEYGRWNDSPIARAAPGTTAFDGQWRQLGVEISREDFETDFAKADATSPHTIGGTPLWVSDIVSWTIVLVLLGIVGAVVYGLTRLFGG